MTFSNLVLLLLLVAVVYAAEVLDARMEVYVGAACGLVLGAVGFLFSELIIANHRAGNDKKGEGKDPLTLWIKGFLVRMVILGLMALAMQAGFKGSVDTAMYAMAGVFLSLHFLELQSLYKKLLAQ